MKYTESKLSQATHKKEVATQMEIQNAEVQAVKLSTNVYCVIEQNILSKTSKILKAFNTEAKAKAFALNYEMTTDYNLVIEPIKLE